jgi:electron transfer flavoprotein alpha subunit
MADVYIYGIDEDQIREMIAFAQDSDLRACVICLGDELSAAQRTCGADAIMHLQNPSTLSESYAYPIAELLQDSEAVAFLTDSCARSRELAAHVAGFLNAPMLSDISSLSCEETMLTGERIIFGGVMTRTTTIEGFGVITVPNGFHGRIADAREVKNIKSRVVENADERVAVQSREEIVKSGVDLNAAPTVVCVGLGVQNIVDLPLIEDLAAACGGAIACTRGVAEDRGWLPTELYIGISGKMLNPDLYLGIAASGQIQHVYGIRGAKIIAAINTDESAPIIKSSDYAVIGDWKEIVPLLGQTLAHAS